MNGDVPKARRNRKRMTETKVRRSGAGGGALDVVAVVDVNNGSGDSGSEVSLGRMSSISWSNNKRISPHSQVSSPLRPELTQTVAHTHTHTLGH